MRGSQNLRYSWVDRSGGGEDKLPSKLRLSVTSVATITIPTPMKKPMPERKRPSPVDILLNKGAQAQTPPAISKYPARKGNEFRRGVAKPWFKWLVKAFFLQALPEALLQSQ